MAIHLRTFNALIGGVAGALDSLSSGNFTDGDISRVITSTGIYFYSYDLTSGAVESSPSVIAPDVLDAAALNGRHLLMFKLIPMDGTQDVEAAVDFTVGILMDGPKILSGSGTPEGVVTAVIGSVYLRKDGGEGTTVYTKVSGSGNTGWTALTVYTDEYTSGNATFTGNVTVEGTAILTTVTVGGDDVTADLGKLHDVTADASELNQCDGKTLVNTEDEQSISGPKTLISPVLDTGVSGTAVLDEDDMASDSATKLATQQSIKAHVAKASTSFSPGGDLTGTVYIARIGKLVSMSFEGLTHSSDYNVASAIGVVPAAYRPIVSVATSLGGSTGVQTVSVSSSGTISISYRDWAGSNRLSTITGDISLSWVIA